MCSVFADVTHSEKSVKDIRWGGRTSTRLRKTGAPARAVISRNIMSKLLEGPIGNKSYTLEYRVSSECRGKQIGFSLQPETLMLTGRGGSARRGHGYGRW